MAEITVCLITLAIIVALVVGTFACLREEQAQEQPVQTVTPLQFRTFECKCVDCGKAKARFLAAQEIK